MSEVCWIWASMGKSLHGLRITPQVAYGNVLIGQLV